MEVDSAPGNRFLKRLDEERQALRDFRSEGGKTLGYLCKHFPPAVAAGLGLWPVRMLCEHEADIWLKGEMLLRPDVCPIVKSFIGGVSSHSGTYGDVDAWLGLYTCDQMRRGMQYVSGELGADVHPVHLPATRSRESEDYYVAQIRRFAGDAEALYGVSFDPDRACRWQREFGSACTVAAAAIAGKALPPLHMHSMVSLMHMARPFGLADFMRKVMDDVPTYSYRRSVIVVGGPIALHDTRLYEELERERVAAIPLNCSGLDALEGESIPGASDDILDHLARSAFTSPHCARTRPNSPLYDRVRRYLSQSGASGIVIKNLKHCDYWYAERVRASSLLEVPVLYLDSDYSRGALQRMNSRLSAFLETL